MNASYRVWLNGAVKIGSEVTEEELQLALEPVLRSFILKEDFSAPTFEDAAYTAILTALTTGTLNVGTAQVNTDTPTTSPADYTSYVEQLKQLKKDRQQHTQWLASIGAQDTSLNTLAKYEKAKYNNSPEYRLLQIYARDVNDGWISPNASFKNYFRQHQRLQNEVVGKRTKDGTLITGMREHFMQRLLGTAVDPQKYKDEHVRISRSGVTVDAVKDALFHAEKIDLPVEREDGKRSVRYVGAECIVTVNPDTGELIQTNRRKRGKKNARNE